MSELANYSIETDHLVLLAFKDGVSLRVPLAQLHSYLAPKDLHEIRRAMKLRREFFRQHMPKTLLVLTVIGLAALVATGGGVLAYIWQEAHSTQPPHTEIVRNSAPVATGQVPEPAANPVAPLAKRHIASRPRVEPSLAPVPSKLSQPAVQVTPIPIPATTPDKATLPTPTPTPAPLNEPITPPSGAVLGDATGPSPAPIKP